MIDEKIARAKELIRKREEIDTELNALFGGAPPLRRGRPRKEQGSANGTGTTVTVGHSHSDSTSTYTPDGTGDLPEE